MAVLHFDKTDPQQFDLYDAEKSVLEHRHIRHYRDLDQAKVFIDRVITSKEWRALGGKDQIKIKRTRNDSGIATCYSHKNQICLPGWALNQQTILHELAHLVTNDAHGPIFAGTAIMLYRKFISDAFATQVEAAYTAHGVKFKRRRFAYKKAENE